MIFIKYGIYIIANKRKVDRLTKFINTQIDKGSIYIIDQIIHVITIYILCYVIARDIKSIDVLEVFKTITVPKAEILRITLMFLLILKPINVTFKKILNNIKPVGNEIDHKEDKNNGQLVGCLERMLVLILLLVGQYTAIGLVFTAKSISRYDKIAKNKQFAEYYLIGTLFSLLSTIIIFLSVSSIK